MDEAQAPQNPRNQEEMKKAINEDRTPAKQALCHPVQIINIDMPGEPDQGKVKNKIIQEIDLNGENGQH